MFFLCEIITPVFPRSRSDSKSRLVSWTLLSIVADFNSALVWMTSILSHIFSASNLFSMPSGLKWLVCFNLKIAENFVSQFLGQILVCTYWWVHIPLVYMLEIQTLHSPQRLIFKTQFCLPLKSFWASIHLLYALLSDLFPPRFFPHSEKSENR